MFGKFTGRYLGNIAVIALSFLVGGVVVSYASPSDIRGSGNVAVTGFHNDSGDFVLWSSGRITDTSGKDVNGSGAYSSAGVTTAKRIANNLMGSPQVAVGVLQTLNNTLVVFSDGSVRKPNDSKASAPKSDNGQRVVFGTIFTLSDSKAGSDGWSINSGSVSAGKTNAKVVFNKAFKSRPTVFFYNSKQPNATMTEVQNSYAVLPIPMASVNQPGPNGVGSAAVGYTNFVAIGE